MTHCQRILAILDDGEWHEKSEFYGFCVLHSRISELRHKHGYTIEKEHRCGKVFYRLAAVPELVVREGELVDGTVVARPPGPPVTERQLTVWEAAA